MRKILLLLSSIASQFSYSQVWTNQNRYLDINNVKAYITSSATNFYNPLDSLNSQGYEVPKGSGIKTSYANCLWFGGYDVSNNLKVCAQTYGGTQFGSLLDFWAGPALYPGQTNQAISNAFGNNSFKINKTTIDSFKTAFANGIPISYPIPSNILNWPGNFPFGSTTPCAPFFDANNDGKYSPLTGEYPLIKGDQAIFSVFNDQLNMKTASQSPTMGIEVRRLSYAYKCDTTQSNLDVINYTTFHEYEIVNKYPNILENFKIGIWDDTDLGNPADDYIGCDVKNSVGYFYNADALDETVGTTLGYQTNTPIFAYKIFDPGNNFYGTDGYDNDGDNLIDEADEANLNEMNRFNYFNNNNTAFGNPFSSLEYYYYLSGKFRNGVSTVYGRSGTPYAGATPTKYCFPGTSDSLKLGTNGITPNNNIPSGWTESNNGLSTPNLSGDRRMIISSPQIKLFPGGTKRFRFAMIFTPNPQSLSFQSLLPIAKQDWQTITNMYTTNTFPSCSNVSQLADIRKKTNTLIAFPNPAESIFYIKGFDENEKNIRLNISDINGKIIQSKTIGKTLDYISIDINTLENGIYFVSANGKTFKLIKAN